MVATEISVTDSDEVLVARMVSGLQTLSSSAKMLCFRSRCSGTASMTRSTSLSDGRPTANVDPAEQGVAIGLGQLAAGHRAVGRSGQVRAAPIERRLGNLDRHHVDTVAGKHLDDAGTHGPQADYADAVDLSRHRSLLPRR